MPVNNLIVWPSAHSQMNVDADFCRIATANIKICNILFALICGDGIIIISSDDGGCGTEAVQIMPTIAHYVVRGK